MNPNREELLFQLALTKPTDERAAWLKRECGDDKALCARVAALLAAHEQPDELLAAPAAKAAAATMKMEFVEEMTDEARLPPGGDRYGGQPGGFPIEL